MEHLVPFLPDGLTLSILRNLPESAQNVIITEAEQKYALAHDINEYEGLNRLFARIPIEEVHDFYDLECLFNEYPSAVLRVQMPSGKPATVTGTSLQQLLWEHDADYVDSDDYDMANFHVLSVIRNNEQANEIMRERLRQLQHQPNLAGIDDIRFKIAEKYVPNDYYCPSNLNCIGKCIVKYLEITGNISMQTEINTLQFDTVATLPEINAMLRKVDSQIRVISYTNKDTSYNSYTKVPIYKYEIKPGYYHAILILDVNKYRNTPPKLDITYDYTDLEHLNHLDTLYAGERKKIFKISTQKYVQRYAFDFETYMNAQKQEAYLLQWGNDKHVDYVFDTNNPKKLYAKFLDFLKQKLWWEDRKRKKGDMTSRQICMFSFNGSHFDNHLFLEHFNDSNWTIKKTFLGDECTIKKFSIKCKALPFKNEVFFIDAMLFFPLGTSLKKACQTFGCQQQKDNMDITKYMTKDAILANKDKIIEYGCQDVRATFELMYKYENYMKEISGTNISIFNYVSLANYANSLRDYYHDENLSIYYNKRKEIAEFERNCVIGGRLIVGQLKYDKPSVPADINGLYASAMKQFEYPCGKRTYYNQRLHPHIMEEYKHRLNHQQDIPFANLRVKFEINPKCLIPMLPVKNSDLAQLINIGDFTMIELQQAIQHGKYKILDVLFIQEFESSAKLFERFVDTFYEKRLEYQRKMVQAQDPEEKAKYDLFQTMCKLLVNSSYGSLLLKPFDSIFRFISKETFHRDFDETMELITISNDQYFVKHKNKCHHDNSRPIYLGAFILSYSKVILNRYIDALDGFHSNTILYCDTDSFYIPKTLFGRLKKAGLVGEQLGQCKNDYGNTVIEKFRTIGKKSKICLLNNGEIKATLKGFKGLKIMSMENKLALFHDFDKAISDVSKEVFKETSYETMRRNALQINVTQSTRSFKVTVYDQYSVIDGKCYPKYYSLLC
jgi:hypothetical protein